MWETACWATKALVALVRAILFHVASVPIVYHRARRETRPYACAELNTGIRELLRFAEGLDTASCLGRMLRLTDVIGRLNQAARLGVDLDVTIALGISLAVQLTTTCGSKGLVFDLVYLLDADDDTWHRSRWGSGLYPSNLLFGEEKGDDDTR